MRFYGMSYREVMDMPITVFWTVSKNAERIDAYEQLKLSDLHNALGSADSLKDYRERLTKQMGDFVKGGIAYDTTRDQTGFEELKRMM